jgi:hypothetical protein
VDGTLHVLFQKQGIIWKLCTWHKTLSNLIFQHIKIYTSHTGKFGFCKYINRAIQSVKSFFMIIPLFVWRLHFYVHRLSIKPFHLSLSSFKFLLPLPTMSLIPAFCCCSYNTYLQNYHPLLKQDSCNLQRAMYLLYPQPDNGNNCLENSNIKSVLFLKQYN